MKTPFRDGYVRDLAEEILQLSKVSNFLECTFFYNTECMQIIVMLLFLLFQNGLERRGYKEVGFLREVDAVISSGEDFNIPASLFIDDDINIFMVLLGSR